MDRWTVLRGLVVVGVVGLLVSIESGVRAQGAQLRALEGRLVVLDQKLQAIGDVRKIAPVMQAPDARPAAGAAHAGRGKKNPSAGARAKTQGTAFSALIDRLYDAADELAAQEDWPPETYDRVSEIFEWTAAEMTALQQQFQAKKISVDDAKKRAVGIRDQASKQLGEVLGDDAMARLKAAWTDAPK